MISESLSYILAYFWASINVNIYSVGFQLISTMVIFKLVCILVFACTTGALPFGSSSSNANSRNEHNRPRFANVESHAELQVQLNYKLNIVEHYGGTSKEDTKSNGEYRSIPFRWVIVLEKRSILDDNKAACLFSTSDHPEIP